MHNETGHVNKSPQIHITLELNGTCHLVTKHIGCALWRNVGVTWFGNNWQIS